jgi:hypothetical protein
MKTNPKVVSVYCQEAAAELKRAMSNVVAGSCFSLCFSQTDFFLTETKPQHKKLERKLYTCLTFTIQFRHGFVNADTSPWPE